MAPPPPRDGELHPQPPPTASKPTFLQTLACALSPAKVAIGIKTPAFTDDGHAAVFFSKQEVLQSYKPLEYAIIARCSYGRPSMPETKSFLAQRLKLQQDFSISALSPRHLLLRFSVEDDFLKVLLRKNIYVKGFLFWFSNLNP